MPTWRNAMELFDKAKYGAAQYELERVVDASPTTTTHPHRGRVLQRHLRRAPLPRRCRSPPDHLSWQEHPEDLHVGTVKFELFKHTFAQKKWKEALAWSDQVDRFALEPKELEEYRFKRGYALLPGRDKDKALGEFAEVQNGTGLCRAQPLLRGAHQLRARQLRDGPHRVPEAEER
jgi:hypothetical protein